jgi:hypothetical protein
LRFITVGHQQSPRKCTWHSFENFCLFLHPECFAVLYRRHISPNHSGTSAHRIIACNQQKRAHREDHRWQLI